MSRCFSINGIESATSKVYFVISRCSVCGHCRYKVPISHGTLLTVMLAGVSAELQDGAVDQQGGFRRAAQ